MRKHRAKLWPSLPGLNASYYLAANGSWRLSVHGKPLHCCMTR